MVLETADLLHLPQQLEAYKTEKNLSHSIKHLHLHLKVDVCFLAQIKYKY